MKFYAKLFALNLKSQMQYKFSLFLSCLRQFITAFTSFFSVQFIFMQIASVNNFTYSQVLLCLAVIMLSFSIGEAMGGGLTSFPRMVNVGEFDRILTCPRNHILQVIIPLFDFTRIGLLVQGGIVLAMAIPQSGVVWTAPKVMTLIIMADKHPPCRDKICRVPVRQRFCRFSCWFPLFRDLSFGGARSRCAACSTRSTSFGYATSLGTKGLNLEAIYENGKLTGLRESDEKSSEEAAIVMAGESTAEGDGDDGSGQTIAERMEPFAAYGVSYQEIGGKKIIRYGGQSVDSFADVRPDGSVFSVGSTDGGEIVLVTDYDGNGTLKGVKAMMSYRF